MTKEANELASAERRQMIDGMQLFETNRHRRLYGGHGGRRGRDALVVQSSGADRK